MHEKKRHVFDYFIRTKCAFNPNPLFSQVYFASPVITSVACVFHADTRNNNKNQQLVYSLHSSFTTGVLFTRRRSVKNGKDKDNNVALG